MHENNNTSVFLIDFHQNFKYNLGGYCCDANNNHVIFLVNSFKEKLSAPRYFKIPVNNDDEPTWRNLELSTPNITEKLSEMGLHEPSPLQREMITQMIDSGNNKDVVCESFRGTERLIAYSIGIMERIHDKLKDKQLQALIMLECKESTNHVQYSYAVQDMLTSIGGDKLIIRNHFSKKTDRNDSKCHVIVSNRNLIQNTCLNTSRVKLIVLDYDFVDHQDIEILQLLPIDVQVFLLVRNSPNISSLESFLKRTSILIPKREPSYNYIMSANIIHFYIDVELDRHLFNTLLDLHESESKNKHKMIIYFNSVFKTTLIEHNFNLMGQSTSYVAKCGYNREAIEGFEANKNSLLAMDKDSDLEITSDLIINFDLPYNLKSYFNRIQSKSNEKCKIVLNLVKKDDFFRLKEIESFYSIHITECPVDYANFL